jgi:molybdate transport system substrate-binding protein
MATRRILSDLADEYERQKSLRAAIESVGGVDAARRVEGGEAFDFVVLASDAIDRLIGSGRLDPASRIDLVHSGVAIAVASGAPKPDIRSEASLRQAVLAARSVGYSTGPSGVQLARLFERWGIAGTIASRIVQAPPGVPVAELVACGQVELGFQQLSELMHVPGIDVIGPMPAPIQVVTTFSAAVCTASARPADARDLLAFLASPATDAAKRRHGMEPAREDVTRV